VCDDSMVVEDLKGCIEGGIEQRRHPRPLAPDITLTPTPKDMFIEREIKCDLA